MSKIGLSNWAVDLKDMGAVYPLQGPELMMAIRASLWIIWHIVQIRQENAELCRGRKSFTASHSEAIAKALEKQSNSTW